MKALLLAAGLAALPAGAEDRVVRDFLTHVAAHPSGDAAASFAAADYADPEALRRLPIGVFDSGIGGLTVLEALLSLDAVDNVSLRPGADGVAALRLVASHMKQLVEPSSAIVLAAVLAYRARFAGRKVGLVLSGGNLDLDALPALLPAATQGPTT